MYLPSTATFLLRSLFILMSIPVFTRVSQLMQIVVLCHVLILINLHAQMIFPTIVIIYKGVISPVVNADVGSYLLKCFWLRIG